MTLACRQFDCIAQRSGLRSLSSLFVLCVLHPANTRQKKEFHAIDATDDIAKSE